jgi:ribosomal protein S18 acetylase RimI-like enzyme
VTIELRPAAERSAAELAELFTAGYAGYQFPIHLDEAAFTAMAAVSDFDLELSRVAFRGDAPVGIVALAVRGDEAWIGGLGVVPEERRRGIGRVLMEAVLEGAAGAGVREVSLEVLEPNHAAIALYDRLGFRTTRLLEVWTLDGESGGSEAAVADVGAAHAWIRANRRHREPWQRSDASVANMEGRPDALMLGDEGAVLYRSAGEALTVLQLAARTPEAAAALLNALRARGTTVRFVNVPEGDVASTALRGLGGRLEARQLEMAWSTVAGARPRPRTRRPADRRSGSGDTTPDRAPRT